jgi:putative membrane protein
MMTTAARLLPLLVCSLCLATPASATDSPAGFAAKAAQANLFELQASDLALKRSQDGDVKQVARLILADHQKADRDLAAAAKMSQLPLPDRLDAAHQARLDALKAQKDEKFDKAWLNAEADAHAEAIALFGDYSANGTDGALKTFATANLPTLKAHQQRVHDFTIR